MCNYREDHRQPAAREALRRKETRVPSHSGSTPRGNPELDRRDLDRGVEKLRKVLTH